MTSWAWASRTEPVDWMNIFQHTTIQLMNCISSKSIKYCESERWHLSSSKFVGCFHNKQVPRSLEQFQVLSSDPFDRLLQEDFGFGKHLGRQEVSECWCRKMLFCILKDAFIMCIWMQIKVSKCVYISMYSYINIFLYTYMYYLHVYLFTVYNIILYMYNVYVCIYICTMG